jgi:phenylacetate-coenzyme A ligase PaaK-like adenylate-forming protein
MSVLQARRVASPAEDASERRIAALLARHFDPVSGSRFWLARAAALGIHRPHRRLRTLTDLEQLGPLPPAELRGRPVLDLVPQSLHGTQTSFILAQTGGTTGPGVWTAWDPAAFESAFVTPFVLAAEAADFPRGGRWLAVCPSGPHIIGRAAAAIARATGAMDPFTVDLDPRWIRLLDPASLVRRRYADHVLSQAMAVLEQQPVDVLFATPPLLLSLGERLPAELRHRIRGVHYGGMSIRPEDRRRLEQEAFPHAVHLSGYGNTLLGCCLELPGAAPLDHFPHGDRLRLDVRDAAGEPLPAGRRGQVHATRLDDAVLLVALAERDEAELIMPPSDAPAGFIHPGLRRPEPLPSLRPAVAGGLY